MLMSDLRRDYFLTRLIDLTPENAGRIESVFSELSAVAIAQFAAEGIPEEQITFRAHGNLRYTNQEHGVEIALPDGSAVEEVARTFHEAYEREYTYRLDTSVEFVGGHLIATAEVGKLEPARLPVTGRALAEALKETRGVDYALEGVHEADIYDGELLEPGMAFTGPAVVETKGQTTLLHPGNEVTVDELGNLVISL
jgi:N-methylhydantoinase A